MPYHYSYRQIIALTCLLFVTMRTGLLAQQGKQKEDKALRITGIPIISYSSSLGVIAGGNGMAFFPLTKKDTISPISMVSVRGIYTGNKSWMVAAFTRLYFSEDKWRLTVAGGTGNINFQYFDAVEESGFVDYSSVRDFLFLQGLRKIKGHLYGGATFKMQYSNTEFSNSPDSNQTVFANGLGLSVLYDSRNNVYYPNSGWQINANMLSNPSWLGSDSVFNAIRLFANYYFPINASSVLAARLSIYAGLGNVPFTGQHAVGGKDIRGYTNGKYRGNQSYALQAEYRWFFANRWGLVGFAGMAFTEKPSSSILPGGGAGLRFKAIPSRNITIGIDGAIGKDDHGIYFRINEAF